MGFQAMAEMDDDELLDALGVEIAPLNASSRTPREDRIIAGFEDILRFYQTHGRAPQHGEGRDIFERLYAVRLDQIRRLPEARALLVALDSPGLLSGTAVAQVDVDALDEDVLLAKLGIDTEPAGTERHHCAAPCASLRRNQGGGRSRQPYALHGFRPFQAFVHGRDNPRLRVIFDNHTENNLLLRSLSRSLYPDGNTPVGRRLIRKDDGPLFSGAAETDDIETGTIYVLRSLSSHPFIAEHRELIHKIGVTGGDVQNRIAGAEKDATYLLADVEVVATYKLHNLNRTKLEHIFHRLFGTAQLDLTIEDRFGNPVRPREWFLVPLHVIDEVVQRIRDSSITNVVYDPQTARLVGQST